MQAASLNKISVAVSARRPTHKASARIQFSIQFPRAETTYKFTHTYTQTRVMRVYLSVCLCCSVHIYNYSYAA